MRAMKFTLWATYITLILLLLMNCRGCNNSSSPTRTADETVMPTPAPTPAPAPRDSTDVVKKAESIGNSGALKITLLWNFPGDIDLRITQPNGKEIYWDRKKDTETGGYLDTDNREGGNGAAENIFWVSPQAGKYSVKLKYHSASETRKIIGSGECTVVVFQEGRDAHTYKVHMSKVGELIHITNIVVE